MSDSIQKVLIVGSGWVGRQVAARLAAFGLSVGLTDKQASAIADALRWIENCHLPTEPFAGVQRSPSARTGSEADSPASETLVHRPELGSSEPRNSWADRIESMLPLDQLTSEDLRRWQPDLAIECVPEQISLKKRVLRRLSALVPRRCIIASNSSYFVPSILSQFVEHPERYAHLHFHVPVIRPTIVDIVGGPATDPAVIERLVDLCHRIAQDPLLLRREHPGYVFNWLLQAVLKAALELVALDVVDPRDIDRSWKSVTGMPLGPFGMMDQIGLDVIDQVLSNARWVDLPEVQVDRLLAVIRPLIDKGRLGVKSGAGFYDYPPGFD